MPTPSTHVIIDALSPVAVDEDFVLARPLLQRNQEEEEKGEQEEQEEQRRGLRALASYNSTSQLAIVGANLCPIESLDYEYLFKSF